MKIILEKPYSDFYRFGYLVTNRENRRMVVLFNSNKDRSTTAYARYKLACSIGRLLTDEEQVDHIDGDKTNDELCNLQILSPTENHHKTFKTGETMLNFVCPICNKDFTLTKQKAAKKANPTCSRKCGYAKTSLTLKNKFKL